MGFKKRVLAVLLAAATMMGGALSASAATTSSRTDVEPATSKYDNNKVDHPGNLVVSKLSKTSATVTKIQALKNNNAGKGVTISTARVISNNKKAKTVPVTAIAKKAFNSKKGRIVTSVTINSKKRVTVKSQAFSKSKVKKLVVRSKITLKKNAFNGTKVKNPKILLSLKKASSVKVEKGAFKGLNSKAKIYVSKMGKKQFNTLKKKLVKAGFKGTIKRI